MVFVVDWKVCVLKVGEGYVCVYKLVGVSVVLMVDNVKESCLVMFERVAGLKEGILKLIYCLDVGMEGVLVFGMMSVFVKEFGDMLVDRSVIKVYCVLMENVVFRGVYIYDVESAIEGSRKMIMMKVDIDDIDGEIEWLVECGGGEWGGVSGLKCCILWVLKSENIVSARWEIKVEFLIGWMY